MGVVHIFGLLCLLAATVLMVVVSVSLPVWKDVYFLTATVSGSGRLRMGNWGICFANQCSKSKLGYDLSFIQANGDRISTAVVHGLTYALILTPIAAGFSFLALLFAIGSNLVLGILGSIFAFLAFLVTLVSFAIDLGLFLTARHRLNDLQGVNATLGNAIWLVLATVALQLTASFTVCFTHKSNRKSRDIEGTHSGVNNGRGGWFGRNRGAYASNGTAPGAQPVMMESGTGVAPKRHFWQKRNNNVATY